MQVRALQQEMALEVSAVELYDGGVVHAVATRPNQFFAIVRRGPNGFIMARWPGEITDLGLSVAEQGLPRFRELCEVRRVDLRESGPRPCVEDYFVRVEDVASYFPRWGLLSAKRLPLPRRFFEMEIRNVGTGVLINHGRTGDTRLPICDGDPLRLSYAIHDSKDESVYLTFFHPGTPHSKPGQLPKIGGAVVTWQLHRSRQTWQEHFDWRELAAFAGGLQMGEFDQLLSACDKPQRTPERVLA